MKELRPLFITALLANLVTLILSNYVTSLPPGSGMDLIFMIVAMPVVWLTSLIITGIILFIKRKALFQKSILTWTILTLIFATPIPALTIYRLRYPPLETRSNGEEINTINGKLYKLETWEITTTHQKFANKRFVADSAQEALYGDKAYKKDSIWVYFNNKGDTMKVEYYKNDSLIATKQPKTK